jgi:hypothetical protein
MVRFNRDVGLYFGCDAEPCLVLQVRPKHAIYSRIVVTTTHGQRVSTVSILARHQLDAGYGSVQKAVIRARDYVNVLAQQRIMANSSATDLKSAGTTDVEKQLTHDVPVLTVAAPKTLGSGVSGVAQKICGVAKM